MAAAARKGFRRLRLHALQLLGAALVALVLAGTVAGADSITPAEQTLNLGVGSTFQLRPTLHLDAAPPKADILLALDTTGSMGAAITDARGDANAIVNDIQESIPGARFAVADFKDYGEYPWRLDQDFTTNEGNSPCGNIELVVSPIACALNGLSAGGGGDAAEAYNRAFFEAYSDPSLHWADGASRFMIVLGDSLPHDATMNADFPDCPNTPPTDPGRTSSPRTTCGRSRRWTGFISTTRTCRSSRTTRTASRGVAVSRPSAASRSWRSTQAAARSSTAMGPGRSRIRSSG